MADTKTYLKVPYRDGTIRMTPFTQGHLTALTLAQHLKSEARKVNVVFRILHGMMGEEVYEGLTNDFVDGEVAINDLFDLLNGAIEATAAYHKAQGENSGPGSDPGGE